MAVGAGIVAIVGIPLLLRPAGLVGNFGLGVLDRSVFGAQLLTELHRTDGADLDALAAGNAVFGVDMGDICRAGEVAAVKELAGSYRTAGRRAAIADAENALIAVKVGYLVHAALILGTL